MKELEKQLAAAMETPEMQAWLERTAALRQRLGAAEVRSLKRRMAAAEKIRRYLESRKTATPGR